MVELTDYIIDYPSAFLKFKEKFPDEEKWDRLFQLTKRGQIEQLLKIFFAENGLFMEVKSLAAIAVEEKKITHTRMICTIKYENKNEQTIFLEEGEPAQLMAAAVDCLFSALEAILDAKEIDEDTDFEYVGISEVNRYLKTTL